MGDVPEAPSIMTTSGGPATGSVKVGNLSARGEFCNGHCDGVGTVSFEGFDVLLFLLGLASGSGSTFLDFAMGKDNPRNFPLLATPMFQVKAVLYPEQSLPYSRHWVQYGLFLSHFLCLS